MNAGGKSKVVLAWIDDQVYVAHAGLEIDDSWDLTDFITNGFSISTMENTLLFDRVNAGLNEFNNSPFVSAPQGCMMKDILIGDWKSFLDTSEFFGKIHDYVLNCEASYGAGKCKINYVGHSAGGSRAMATLLGMAYRYGGFYDTPDNVRVFSFGQPGTFLQTGTSRPCDALEKFEDNVFRFVSIINENGVQVPDFSPNLDVARHMG